MNENDAYSENEIIHKLSRSGAQPQSVLQFLPELLLPWYDDNKRDLPWRENTDPYRVWVSEIMLQQTRVEAAKDRYLLFMRELPTVRDLADCSDDKLFKLWEGLGYYTRARNLRAAAKIVAEHGFPQDAESWKKLPGIGAYTAGAIASIAFGQPAPAVDGNVVRVLSRLLGDGREQETLKKDYEKILSPVYPTERCGDFTQSLMELGATVCTPSSPKCGICPLKDVCKTKSDALPRPKIKAKRRKNAYTVFVFCDQTRIALYRRKEGVLKDTYAFFNAECELNADAAAEFLRQCGLKNFRLSEPIFHTHVFSHLEWTMCAYAVYSKENAAALYLPSGINAPPFSDLFYAERERTEREYSLSSAFRWCLNVLNDAARPTERN